MGHKSHRNKPRKDIEQAQSKQPTAPKESNWNQPIGGPPASENLLDPQPSKSHSPNSEKAEKYGIIWWKDRLEILGLIAGIIVAFLLYGQWREMVRATRLKTSEDEIGSWAMAGCVDFAHEFSPLDS